MEGPGKLFPVKPRLPALRNPNSSPESNYWKSFKNNQVSGLVLPVTSINFCPEPPHDFAVSSSTTVSIYHGQTFDLKTTISGFSDVAYSATFRPDGKLIAAGDQTGLIQVFDAKTRSVLRRLRGHSRAVRAVNYSHHDKLHLLSGGDDSLVKFWDVAAETELVTLQAHKDYVRTASANPITPNLWATGSYDHTVHVWDVRNSHSVLSFSHGKPVDNVLFLPSGGLIATAGGNLVKIWDVIGGGKLIHSMDAYNKTVTSMCIARVQRTGENNADPQLRLLSVSLDGYMKVFDYASFKIRHSARYPAPLLSVGFSPASTGRVIGTTNGSLFIGRRMKGLRSEHDSERMLGRVGFDGSVEGTEKQVARPRRFRYFERGQGEKPSKDDYLVKRPEKMRLAEHDKHLRKFRHKEALVSVLRTGKAQGIVSVMEELVARKKLLRCISNLDTDELELLLNFLQRLTIVPRYAGFLMGLANKVLHLRAKDIRASEKLKGYVVNLRAIVAEEIQIQHSLQEIQGIISPLLRIAGR